MSTTFRAEVINAKKRQWMGEILIARPISLTFYAAFSVSIVATIIAFLFLGEYTSREHVVGEIVASEGVAKVYSPVSGTIIKKLVSEGDIVKSGQVLYVVSTEKSTEKGSNQVAIGEGILRKRESLKFDLELKRKVFEDGLDTLKQKVFGLEGQLENIQREISTQDKRLKLSEANAVRFRELMKANFVSLTQTAEREQDKLDQEARLELLQRTALSIKTDLMSARSELRNAPLNARSQLAAIERNISDVEQEIYENEVRREIVVTAVQGGRATAVLSELGQSVSPTLPMLSILPASPKFEANLYIPTRSVGFLKVGAKVMLRYNAFPYQKFGQYEGQIRSISQTALTPEELRLFKVSTENLYRVNVQLDQQHIIAYGVPVGLQDGMQVEADVLLDKRKLYEWLFEPLFSISGKI